MRNGNSFWPRAELSRKDNAMDKCGSEMKADERNNKMSNQRNKLSRQRKARDKEAVEKFLDAGLGGRVWGMKVGSKSKV